MKKVYFNYYRKILNPERSRRAFTIIELLIVVFIFSAVILMASSAFATSFIAGRTHSSGSMEANRSLSSVLDIIGQKMANASGKYSTTIRGFSEASGRLTIVLNDNTTCVYFDQDSDAIKMLQQPCSTAIPALSNASWEKISSPDIVITNADFTFPTTGKNVCTTSPCATAPYITVKISGTDVKTNGKAALETTYSIPAYVYNKW